MLPIRDYGVVAMRLSCHCRSSHISEKFHNRPDLSLDQAFRLVIAGRCRSVFDVAFTARVFVWLPVILWAIVGDYFGR